MENSKEPIIIFDTTLRDGEQAPGATMTLEQKLEIALLLDNMHVNVIEAGFPAASENEFKTVKKISENLVFSKVAGLARANKKDIESVHEATKGTENKRIHTFISTSKIHMKYKLKMSAEEVLEAIKVSVTHAKNFTDDVEWSCEDGTRSDKDFLYKCFEQAIKSGATTVNIADTVGFIMPFEFTELIKDLMNNVSNIDKVVFSVHCHNDLGFAVSNSISALRAGARQVECTVNGLGERAGNASLEEIVMTLKTRDELFPFKTSIKTKYFTELSKKVSDYSGFVVPPNKAVVGENAFAHESGIHQHGVIVNPKTYEIINPDKVGAAGTKIVMGKHSGRHAFKFKLLEMGITLGNKELERAFFLFKKFADANKVISDNQIKKIVKSI
ncbi:MAG: 2-isopropylmalate synthase [Rickettsiales bacterium TMED251]|nr:MAG: 2-isopropylmalate synthase [Rickettsiales bacterium TMED251]|tara:strand:- start:219 stop:1376 length:1158 start_codon:yes stop_codon:yes gene_type:complete